MSDSEDDYEHFCFYGKPLDPYDEDSVPKKRPISVEEQIATDAQGRRRFHGAFTGGFSAGFFNTVGSLEGWLPNEFKSSRSEKSERFVQKPQDFMDDEDLGEDGIAPQVVRATSDYSTSRKRKKQVFSEGPIPGEPVLHNILSSGNETIGYMLLKNLRLRDKRKQKENSADGKTYGCEMPKVEENIEFDDYEQYELPEIYREFLAKPKENTFGLGYSGLDKSHFSLFPIENKSKLVMTDKNNKKVSIIGQAFGVGAFEEDDDDIYMKEDMSKYDFELAGEKQKTQPKKYNNNLVLDMFLRSKESAVLKNNKKYAPPKIPHSFTGKHKIRRSRFDPVPEEEIPSTSRINPMIRAKYLGEECPQEHTPSKNIQEEAKKVKTSKKEELKPEISQPGPCRSDVFDINSYLTDRFVSSSKVEDVSNILEPVVKMETVHGTEQMREAARMKMFGPLTRITSDWVPCALLCKRFNVPEPFVEPERTRTKTKNIIFEYQKHVEEIKLKPGLKKENISESAATSEPDIPVDSVEVKQENTAENQTLTTQEETDVKSEDAGSADNTPKDITDRIDLEKQQDLFKAIFLSSDSESEEEKDPKKEEKETNASVEENRKEDLKSAVLSDQLLPKIKPMKEGVLSGINFHKFAKPVPRSQENGENSKDRTEDKMEEKPEIPIDCYGPKVPEKVPVSTKADVTLVSSESDDQWIEKDSDGKKKKKHKKEKKHKKDKHKKHKHERKKKSIG